MRHPTAGIILAAGRATRFGRPKQLLKLRDKPLIEWVLDAALESDLARVILVLGYHGANIQQVLGTKIAHPRVQVVTNHRYQDGLSRSLQAGLRSAQNGFPSVMFLLGDQPLVDPATIDHLLARFWQSDKDICVPVYQGKRGTPTIIGQKFYPRILSLTGDIGARDLKNAHPDRILEVEVNNPLCFFDIDTPEDLAKLETLFPG
ncbi:MAG: nucleotidyltransferase family protein [Desulfobacterales bacterium]|nr:MAG: nucleotidyltransferase family protein [Desulfobacterales bacterium]